MDDHTINTKAADALKENTFAHVILYLDADGIALSIDVSKGNSEHIN